MSHTNYRRKPRKRHKNEAYAWKNASAWRQIIVQQERAASRIVVYTNVVRVPVPKRIPRPWWLLIGIMTMPHYSPPKQKPPVEPQKKQLFGDAPSATCHVVLRKDPGLGWSPIAVFSSGEPALKHAEDFMEKMQAKRPDLELRIEDRIPLITTLQECNVYSHSGKLESWKSSSPTGARIAGVPRIPLLGASTPRPTWCADRAPGELGNGSFHR